MLLDRMPLLQIRNNIPCTWCSGHVTVETMRIREQMNDRAPVIECGLVGEGQSCPSMDTDLHIPCNAACIIRIFCVI